MENKSMRCLSCNSWGTVTIKRHFFQMKWIIQHFFFYPGGTKGTHIWFIKGCRQHVMLLSNWTACFRPALSWAAGYSLERWLPERQRPPLAKLSKPSVSEWRQCAYIFLQGEHGCPVEAQCGPRGRRRSLETRRLWAGSTGPRLQTSESRGPPGFQLPHFSLVFAPWLKS